MIDRLLTVICEFRGGACVAQIGTADEHEAVRNWAENLRETRAVLLSPSYLARAVLTTAEHEHPVAIEGVWRRALQRFAAKT